MFNFKSNTTTKEDRSIENLGDNATNTIKPEISRKPTPTQSIKFKVTPVTPSIISTPTIDHTTPVIDATTNTSKPIDSKNSEIVNRLTEAEKKTLYQNAMQKTMAAFRETLEGQLQVCTDIFGGPNTCGSHCWCSVVIFQK